MFSKKKEEKELNSTKLEMKKITPQKYKRLWDNKKQQYTNKINKLEEMDDFL